MQGKRGLFGSGSKVRHGALKSTVPLPYGSKACSRIRRSSAEGAKLKIKCRNILVSRMQAGIIRWPSREGQTYALFVGSRRSSYTGF